MKNFTPYSSVYVTLLYVQLVKVEFLLLMQLKANNRLLQSIVVLDVPYCSISPLLVWYSQQLSFDEELVPYSSFCTMLLYVKYIEIG